MATNVVLAAIRLCISGHIDIPSLETLQRICAVVANEAHQKLSILPERIELYEKGLVSTSDIDSALADTSAGPVY
jgi:hypothetical protein